MTAMDLMPSPVIDAQSGKAPGTKDRPESAPLPVPSSQQPQSSPLSGSGGVRGRATSEAESIEFIVASQTASFPSLNTLSVPGPGPAPASTHASTGSVVNTAGLSVSAASIDQIDRALSDTSSSSASRPTSSSFTKCRFGVSCININCRFAHPSPASDRDKHALLPAMPDVCAAGIACREPMCYKTHPSPAQRWNEVCRDQDNCAFGTFPMEIWSCAGARG